MAVEFNRERSGNLSTEGGNIGGTIVWNAYSDVAITAEEMRTTGNMPIRFDDEHPDNLDSNMRCDQVRIDAVGNTNRYFKVTATFSIPKDGSSHKGEEPTSDDDPLAVPLVFIWGNTTISSPVDRMTDGQNSYPIVNSAKKPFDTDPQQTFNVKTLTIRRNEYAFNLRRSLTYENTVNSDSFEGANPGECKCTHITPSSDYTQGSAFVTIDYNFEFRSEDIFGEQPHQLKVIDQGFYAFALVDGVDTPVRIYTKDGTPVDEPVLLNGKGIPVESTSYTYKPSPDDPIADPPVWAQIPGSGNPVGSTVSNYNGEIYYLRYDIYPSRSFGSLRS